MKSAGKARNNGLYRHIRTSKEIIRNLLNDSFQSYHLRLDHAALSLTIAAQFLRCRGRSSLVTAVRFLDGRKAFFIDYSGAKYTRFPQKIAAMQKSHFRVVENGKFLNRLLNGHLEKSAATGIFRV